MKQTPLHSCHERLSAKMGEFAGYDMPLYYALGVLKEHEWVRSHCGIFDVSHMGQVAIKGVGTRKFLESVIPSSFEKLAVNKAKYTVLLNDKGGVVDDLMITKAGDDDFHMVINAGCKDKDIAYIKSCLPSGLELTYFEDWALIAVQGPDAERVLSDVIGADLSAVPYMGLWYRDYTMFISRLGYTGEDGFEISVPSKDAPTLWDKLLSDDRVRPIGLAARDSLRLEMGYCLYGHELNEDITPREADLEWVMAKDRIVDFSEPHRKRVGIVLTDKGIAREGTEILNDVGEKIGVMTSGGYSPTLKQSIGQGFVPIEYTQEGTDIAVMVRGNKIPAKITKMPFLKPRTKTGK
jgi:aminomethyltransferase